MPAAFVTPPPPAHLTPEVQVDELPGFPLRGSVSVPEFTPRPPYDVFAQRILESQPDADEKDILWAYDILPQQSAMVFKMGWAIGREPLRRTRLIVERVSTAHGRRGMGDGIAMLRAALVECERRGVEVDEVQVESPNSNSLGWWGVVCERLGGDYPELDFLPVPDDDAERIRRYPVPSESMI